MRAAAATAVLVVAARQEASRAAERREVSLAEATPLQGTGADPARMAEPTVEDTVAMVGTEGATAGIVADTTAEAVSTSVSVLAGMADILTTVVIPIMGTPLDMPTIQAITIPATILRRLPSLRLALSRINTATAIQLSRRTRSSNRRTRSSNSRIRSSNSRIRNSRPIRSSRTTAAETCGHNSDEGAGHRRNNRACH